MSKKARIGNAYLRRMSHCFLFLFPEIKITFTGLMHYTSANDSK
jgi:hypothetical protein